ncbi:unnamed protein product [Ilex paraguariensis]|uniref:Uncharacterized protein n=1 Tax=Ilex paraguariensis TaxID=185542 RepID=A0ABC8S6B4_9AQUA
MSSISSQVVLATAMAVSGTLIILSLFREKPLSPAQLSGNQDSHQEKNILRSCLSSKGKKRERKKKRVKFADV